MGVKPLSSEGSGKEGNSYLNMICTPWEKFPINHRGGLKDVILVTVVAMAISTLAQVVFAASKYSGYILIVCTSNDTLKEAGFNVSVIIV